jgi:hypothetical protein
MFEVTDQWLPENLLAVWSKVRRESLFSNFVLYIWRFVASCRSIYLGKENSVSSNSGTKIPTGIPKNVNTLQSCPDEAV